MFVSTDFLQRTVYFVMSSTHLRARFYGNSFKYNIGKLSGEVSKTKYSTIHTFSFISTSTSIQNQPMASVCCNLLIVGNTLTPFIPYELSDSWIRTESTQLSSTARNSIENKTLPIFFGKRSLLRKTICN